MIEDNKTVKYVGDSYKLRTGAPMSRGLQGAGDFYIHTFMAEKSQIDNYLYTEHLPESQDFRGQFGDFMSANFSRLNDRSGSVFSGKIVHNPDFVDEDSINGGTGTL